MYITTEESENQETIIISDLTIGDHLINLGPVLEISENDDSYALVIDRMQERQVWRFKKSDILIIKQRS